MSADLSPAVKILVDEQRRQSIRPECQADTSDEKALGLLVSRFCRFDGAAVLEVAVAALTDSNFRMEAAIVQGALDRLVAEPIEGGHVGRGCEPGECRSM